jgi:hypothetical protein
MKLSSSIGLLLATLYLEEGIVPFKARCSKIFAYLKDTDTISNRRPFALFQVSCMRRADVPCKCHPKGAGWDPQEPGVPAQLRTG